MDYSTASFSRFCNITGTNESTAKTPRTTTDVQDHASPDADSLYNVCPAWIATNDGGATPIGREKPSIKHINRYYLHTRHSSMLIS